ncbi:hypothetical protein Voja1_00026 [Pseudomonas phage vB_PpuP-Voja-1]|uniref:Uncharacterized protein n=1 Tax=Pseudomonas phage Pf-10 TaxID=1562076 RepID=A0A0A0YX80_9CAUD|nr:hypothetical protein NL61_26 [Pseudomonas phage Pf-10]AIX12988.1 hypothetical protein NL61_26 [Pseudomonas phage Pf-10]QIN95143.1 hypothetical protein B3_00250 [Pseudomonas phage BIM BV-46]
MKHIVQAMGDVQVYNDADNTFETLPHPGPYLVGASVREDGVVLAFVDPTAMNDTEALAWQGDKWVAV